MSGRQNPENGAILGLPIVHPRYARNGTEAGSAGGKTRSRVLKHGLTVREVIAFDECAEQFEQFYQELASALGARDAVEELMVERIVICAWRLRRVYRIESGLLSRARTAWTTAGPKVTRDIDLVFMRLGSGDDELAKLTRYEMALERCVITTLRELHRCQRRPRHAMGKPPNLSSIGEIKK
jgi:hypothetical protein